MIPMSSFMSRYLSSSLAIMLLCMALVGCANSQVPSYPAPSLDDLKAEVPGKLDLLNPNIADTAVTIAIDYPGEYNINQVSAIYSRLAGGGWYYYSDPNNRDYFQNANVTLQRGKISSTIGSGDCDDFAILMASLIESIGGSTRISFAYDLQNKSAHAYAEVYLGKDGDPRVIDIVRWLKEEYNIDEIVGINRTDDEIWLNLDGGSNPTKADYPGGHYFGNQSHATIRKIIWESDHKVSPKIVPMIDNMDSTDGWETIKNYHESTISIDSTPGKKGKGIQITYNLSKGGWVGISKRIDSALLLESTGLNFYYYFMGNKNKIELRLICDDGKVFGATWSISKTEDWSSQNVLYSNLRSLDSKNSYELNKNGFDISKIREIEFIISTPPDNTADLGTIILDDVKGTMANPVGSPWARAEEERLKTDALDLALKSDTVRNTDFIKSVQFAVESLEDYETLAGNRALRKGLDLLPTPAFFLENDNNILKMALSPDGKLLACASEGGGKVWEVASGMETSVLEYDSWVNMIDFSPDSTLVVTANQDNTSYIWNAATGEMIYGLEHGGNVNAAVFSPDGRYIATASDDKTTRIWNTSTGKEVSNLKLDGKAFAVDFSPNGKLLATAFLIDKSAPNNQDNNNAQLDNAVVILDVPNGKELSKIQLKGDIFALSFSPISSLLATGTRDGLTGLACIWDVVSGSELKRMAHNSVVSDISFDSSGNFLATACWDKTARVWDLSTGNELMRGQHEDLVNCAVLSPNGELLATASDDNTARIWKVKSGKELTRIKHDGRVESVSFSPDGNLVATKSIDKTARIWDISKLNEPIRMYHEASLISMALSHDDKYLVTSAADGMAHMWNMTTGRELFRVMNREWNVNSVAFSPDDTTFATASDDNMARIWDSYTGRELMRMNHTGKVKSLAYSPDGLCLATASYDDKSSRIWQVSTGKEIVRMDHDDGVHTVVFSHDGKLMATAAYDNIAHVWDAATGEELAKMNHDEDRWICSIAFSPDDKYLATASSDTTARLWDIATGKEILRMNNDKWVLRIAFSPDGTKIAASCIDNLACIWNATSGARLATMNHEGMNGHDNEVRDITFSPDSKYVATAGDDNTARIWDASTGSELARMEHDERVNCVRFTQDGRRLVTASSDCITAIWLLKPQDLICEACKRLTCNLSTLEWREQHCRACFKQIASNESSESSAPIRSTSAIVAAKSPAISEQESFPVTWTKTFGGPSYEDGMSIQQVSDGGYIMTGNTHSYGNGGAWLVKTDAYGNKLWDKVFGNSTFHFGSTVQQTRDGGFILTGRTNYGGKDAWLIKTDAQGDIIWDKSFEDSFGASIQQTSDGGYIITGSKSESFTSAWLIKTDADGKKIWERTFSESSEITSEGRSVQQTCDGGYIIAGTITNWLPDTRNATLNYTPMIFNNDIWLIKTNERGYIQWDKTFGGSGNDRGRSVQQTREGGFIITGDTKSYGAGGEDLWLIKTDADGNMLWDQDFGGQDEDEGYFVQQTSDGGYIITGVTNFRLYADRADAWLIKTDANGNKLWDKTYGGPRYNTAASVQQTLDSGYIIVGSTDSYGAGGQDFYLIKTDVNGNVGE